MIFDTNQRMSDDPLSPSRVWKRSLRNNAAMIDNVVMGQSLNSLGLWVWRKFSHASSRCISVALDQGAPAPVTI